MHGLDKAGPPSADTAKAMLDKIGGEWWHVYIGGPRASVTWKPSHVEAYRAKGIKHFLLDYVGRQSEDVNLLTRSQGGRDGEEAVRLAENFGFGAGEPLCLDLEQRTFNAAPDASLDYVEGWCSAVRRLGWRPGVYTNVAPLKALAKRTEKPDWVFVARWVRDGPDPAIDHRHIKDLPDDLWVGRRVWQYAGEIDASILGEVVDVDVTDRASGCLTGTTPGAALLKTASLLEDDDMFTFSSNGKPVFFVAGGKAVGLNGQDDLRVVRGAVQNLPHFQLDSETFDQFLRVYRA
jgi:hypothetical protein